MNKQGSFLIELLVYLTVCVFLFFVSYKVIIYSYQNYKTLIQDTNNKINLLKGLNILKEDIELAEPNLDSWKIEKDSIFFKTNNLNISWLIKNNRLYRAEYNFEKRKVKNLISKSIESLNANLNIKEDKVSSVKLNVTMNGKTYNIDIFLINGLYEIY